MKRIKYLEKAKSIILNLILVFLLGFTVLAVFVPLNPNQPESGLDPSWRFALNQAVAQRLVFGRDIIFSLGPYASIYTRLYHPATDSLMVSASLYLGICYILMLLFLIRAISIRWQLFFSLFLAGFMFLPDALILSYPLLLSVVIYQAISARTLEKKKSIPVRLSVFFTLLFIPLGLLPLIKGSFFLISGVVIGLCFFIFWHRQHKVLAFFSILSPLAGLVFFWLLVGQPIKELPYFIFNMIPMILSYTEAMAVPGALREVILYIFTSVGILYVIVRGKEVQLDSMLFLFFSFAAFLFTAFKSGFVRHDGHAVIAGTSIVIAVILLNFVIKHKYLRIVILFSLLTWVCIDSKHVGSSTKSVPKNIKNTYLGAFDGAKMRFCKPKKLHAIFNERIKIIKDEFPILPMNGATDIYSYNQSYLFASGNKWSPRPVFQSYVVYSPIFSKLNEFYLTSGRAPDNIIFKVEPIDGRLPSLEDGLSWPALLNNYSPYKLENGYLFLTKKQAKDITVSRVELYDKSCFLGQDISLTSLSAPLFAEIDIRQTFFGKLISILYKSQRLAISIELSDGSRKNYRIISTMAKSSFLISPLIENTKEFALLYSGKSYLKNKFVKSIKISPVGGNLLMWNSKYSLKLSRVYLKIDNEVAKVLKLDSIR